MTRKGRLFPLALALAIFLMPLIQLQPVAAASFEGYSSSDHFVIHYHTGYEQQATGLLEMHEAAYAIITGLVGYSPPSRLAIYLCTTADELAEFGYSVPEERSCGSCIFQKQTAFFVYYAALQPGMPGIARGLTQAIEGQFLNFKRPAWWKEGLASYVVLRLVSGDQAMISQLFPVLSDSVIRSSPPFRMLKDMEEGVPDDQLGHLAVATAFLYMDESYGETSISAIIRAASESHDVHGALETVLGKSFNAFQDEWKSHIARAVEGIAAAQGAVGAAEQEHRIHGLDGAKERLAAAIEVFNAGRFSDASALAGEALGLAAQSKSPAAKFEKHVEGEHVEVFFHAGYEQQAEELLKAHEGAYSFITTLMGYSPREKVEAYLCATPKEIRDDFGFPFLPDNTNCGDGCGQWNRGVLSYYNIKAAIPAVAAHELTHYIEHELLTAQSPVWWREGLACYAAYRATGDPSSCYSSMLPRLIDSMIKSSPQFMPLDKLEEKFYDTRLGYITSATFFFYLEDEYGEQAVRQAIRTAVTTQDVKGAIEEATGKSFSALQSEWRERLKLAVTAVNNAQNAVAAAEQEYRTYGLDEAKTKLDKAVNAFESGHFKESVPLAGEAEKLAEGATVHPLVAPLAAAAVILGCVFAAVCYKTKKERSQNQPPIPDGNQRRG